jgi:uncharacterized coiled-coil DUF342 family protein
MAASTGPEEKAKEILDKLQKKAAVTDEDLKLLQRHIDELEAKAEPTHHHDHDTKVA